MFRDTGGIKRRIKNKYIYNYFLNYNYMSDFKPINWSEIFYESESSDLDECPASMGNKGEGPLIIAPRQNSEEPQSRGLRPSIRGYLLVTINYPKKTTFDKMLSDKQRLVYAKIWHNIVNTFEIDPEVKEFQTELTQLGRVHLHGILSISLDKYYIAGIVMDMVKTISEQFPVKCWNVVEKFYFPQWERYRGPNICVQYKTADDSYINIWNAYIKKDL